MNMLDDDDCETHLIPPDDVREHEISEECWCCPEEDEDGAIVHYPEHRTIH
jgi:hypothetical protein